MAFPSGKPAQQSAPLLRNLMNRCRAASFAVGSRLPGPRIIVGCLLAMYGGTGATQAAELPPPLETKATSDLARPTKSQLQLQEMAFGLFVHWSPSVYQGTENDSLNTPKERIHPDRFDAGQIVRAAQSCGAGYIVFVAKHVGGYCAWQTKTTGYSLKTAPWKGGQGDMVGELAAACAQAGLKFGVYLCPRDDHAKMGNGGRAGRRQAEANAYYREQLTELLTHYGTLFEVWFDGGAIIPVNDLFERYAPEAVTFQGRRKGSTRWVGSEYGTTAYPCWSTVNGKENELPAKGTGVPDGNLWAPAECDVSILFPKWFWTPGSDTRVMGLERLLDIYYRSVGRGAILLLNITPDDHGAVPEIQLKRLAELGAEIRARFGQPLAATSAVLHEPKGALALPLGGEVTVDHVRLREDIRGGERVRQFKLEAKTAADTWTTLNAGSHIGSRQIIPFPATKATELRLQILNSVGPPAMAEFAAFHVGRPVPKAAYRVADMTPLSAPRLERSRDGLFSFDASSPEGETHYTLDGSEPTMASPVYREPQPLPKGGLVKARHFGRNGRDRVPGPLLVRHLGLPAMEVKVVRVSSEDAAARSALAFDADARTFWQTAVRPTTSAPPHEIVLDLGKSRSVTGLSCLPRQDDNGSPPATVKIFVSGALETFPATPQFEGTWSLSARSPQDWHEALMPAPAVGRFVKISFSGATANGSALAVAEMEILIKP